MSRAVQVMLILGVAILCAASVVCNVLAARWLAGDEPTLLWLFTALAVGSGLVKLAGAVYLERQWQWGLASVVAVALALDICWSLGFAQLTREVAARPRAEAARNHAELTRVRNERREALAARAAPAKPVPVLRAELAGLDTRGCGEDRNKKFDRCQVAAALETEIAAATAHDKASREYDKAAAALAAVDVPQSADPLAASLGTLLRTIVASATDEHAKLIFGLMMVALFELAPIMALPAALKPPAPAQLAEEPRHEPSSQPLEPVRNAAVRREAPAGSVAARLQAVASGPLPAGLTVTATGGLAGSQRALSASLGCNPARLNAELRAAAAAGLIELQTGTRGTVIEFAATSNVVHLRAKQ